MAKPHFVWKEIASGDDGPGLRSRHCLAYDRQARAAVLFSGIRWKRLGRLLADTWELRGGVWSQVDGAEGPEARHRAAMVYDGVRRASVLFGGQGKSGFGTVLGDTWTYSAGRWQLRAASTRRTPPGRCGHAMAFDEHMGAAVLFGGIGNSNATLADTWLYDGTWQRVRGPGPPPRRYAGLAYDPNLQGCLLYSGVFDDWGLTPIRDAWLFHAGRWLKLDDLFAPDERDDHGMCYHRRAGTLIMLDGIGSGQGVLARTGHGWQRLQVKPLQPRRQCSPLIWDEDQKALIMHGGETGQRGRQFDVTLALCLADDEADNCHAPQDAGGPIELLMERQEASSAGDDLGANESRAEEILAFLTWAEWLRATQQGNGSCLVWLLAWVAALLAIPWLPFEATWYWITLYVVAATVIDVIAFSQVIRSKVFKWCRAELIPLAKQEGFSLEELTEAIARFGELDAQQRKQLGALNINRDVVMRAIEK